MPEGFLFSPVLITRVLNHSVLRPRTEDEGTPVDDFFQMTWFVRTKFGRMIR